MRASPTEYVIDPRHFRKDRFYTGFLILFWIVWTPVTLFVTGLAGSSEENRTFLLFWLCFGWLGVLLVPWVLLTANRKEHLCMSAGRLLVRKRGLLRWNETVVERDQLRALTLEHVDEESVLTLNLVLKGRALGGRVMLAALVHPEGKEALFREIEPFLREHGFSFEARNERAAARAAAA